MVTNNIGRILVVDDEVELKNILVEALTSQGYKAAGFTSGEEALSALRGEAFDVLLTDLMMPEMDGIMLVRESLQIDPHLVAIMMTGQGTIQTAVEAMKVGASDYVLKPFRLQTVLPVLTRAMNTRHMRLENLQLRETVAIYELAQTIAFTLDPRTLLSKVADAALQQTNADEVSILLPTGDGSDELYVAAVRGENRHRLLGERVPAEESISGWVAREREPLMLEGEIKDNRFRSLWPHPEIRSAVSIPMQVANKLIGIINVNALNRPRPFTLGQMKALTILASTAAAALESASLYTQVQKAEENYRSIFENAVEGMFQSTPQGRFITVNPAMARIFGYDSPNEMIEGVTDITHQIYVDPEDRVKSAELTIEQEVLHGFEFQAYRKDGKQIWVSLNRRSVCDENGIELYREGSVEDITEHKRAEDERAKLTAEIENQRQRLNNIVASVPGVVWEAWGQPDAATQRMNFVSDYVETMLGYRVEEWLSTPNFWLTIVHPDDKEHTGRAAAAAFASGKSTSTLEFRWIAKDGSAPWVESTSAVIKDDQGRPVGIRGVTIDITERKRAEEALRESEERYKGLIDSAFDGVVIHREGTVVSANRAFAEMFEYGPDEVIGMEVLEFTTPECRELVRTQITEDESTFESVGLRKDGSRIPIEISGQVCLYQGQPARFAAVRDISERKRVEEIQTRRATHALFRADVSAAFAVSRAPLQPTLELCAEAMVQHLNAAFARVWTFNREENSLELQASAGIYTHINGPHSRVPFGAFKIGKIAEERLAHITNDVQTDPRVSDKEWEKREGMVSFAGYPLIVEDRLLGVMAIFAREELAEDTLDALASVADLVSQGVERKRAEQELRESEERYRDLVENAHDIIYSHDLNGNYTSINKAGEQITGYARAEVLKLNLAQAIAPEHLARPREMMSRKLAGESVTAYEMDIIAKDGRRIAVEANTKLVFQDGVPVGVQGIARDVTERKHLEEQLRQSQKMEAIGQLAGGVAHDFNNLLTAINGYSSLALQRMNGNDPIRGYLEEIKKAGDRAANLTRQLLAFGRKQMLQPLALNLNDVVADMNKMLRRLIGEDIRLTAKFDPALKKIKADLGQIEQVLVNLVVNARDAMPQGGQLTIETANVELEREYVGKHVGVQPGSYVILSVSDTGTGMDDETKARIFEPFFTTKEKGKGTGLGLSTVYGIVKQSGGNIWVYSEPGQGTTFRVYLPQLLAAAKPIEKVATEAAAPGGSETILLVEDEDIVRGLARKILEQSGYNVLDARGGEEAIRLCQERSEPIHLLLTDVVMPETSGKEIAERLTTLRPTTRVLFMSGYTDEAIVHHGVLDSNVEFIQKPFTPMALAKKVREVLDLKGGGNGKS
jgi:two-component system cell cycle sensor histidine kinase/response regulator CckA